MRARDRALGITLGILLGLAIVIGFIFFSSGETIDDPDVAGEGSTTQRTAPARPAP
jgi:hypothetical protein